MKEVIEKCLLKAEPSLSGARYLLEDEQPSAAIKQANALVSKNQILSQDPNLQPTGLFDLKPRAGYGDEEAEQVELAEEAVKEAGRLVRSNQEFLANLSS